jgi:threonine/homoserine/homoserine lactone efflux protein
MTFVKWVGVLFLLYVAIKLAFDNGNMAAKDVKGVLTAIEGALLQWLNPKAWLASIAGIAAYAANADKQRMLVFVAIYFLIYYASIGCWAFAGSALSE